MPLFFPHWQKYRNDNNGCKIINNCVIAPLPEKAKFDSFSWLSSGQARCAEYAVDDKMTEVWTKIPSVWNDYATWLLRLILKVCDLPNIIILSQSEDERIIVVEVNKCDRSKITQYSEFDKTSGNLIFTIEMKMFVPIEPDPYFFEVPVACFD